MAATTSPKEDELPGVADLGASHWTELARKHWSRPVKIGRVQTAVIETELWDALERENFHARSLLILETLQLLEK